MSFVSPTNNAPPANNPPLISPYQSQQQSQNQTQTGPNSALDAYFNDLDNNSSEADSSSSSTGNVEQSAIQINNIQAGEYGYGVGITRPTPFMSLTGFYHDGGGSIRSKYGGQVSVVFPFGGGKSDRLSQELIEARTETVAIANTTKFLSICNTLRAQNVTVDYSVNDDPVLARCQGLLKSNKKLEEKIEARNLPTEDLIKKMHATLQRLEYENQKLRRQLETVQNNEINPFDTDGE